VIINCHTIKPIDTLTVINAARICGAIVTIEEHQIEGGLGSTVAEVISQEHPVPMEFIGVRGKFGESAKTYQELWKKHGLTKENIIESVKRVITRKSY
jgi:transketolase